MSEAGKGDLSEELDELEALTRPGREDELRTFLLLLHPVDVADLVHDVSEKTAVAILRHLDQARAAELLSELDPEEQARLLKQLRPQEAAPIVGQMETDDLADLLQDLDQNTASEILAQLPSPERAEVTELLRYDPSSAGGLMQTELAQVPVTATIAEALEAARTAAADEVQLISLYVVDEQGRYVGDLPLPKLVFSKPSTRVQDVLTPKVTEVAVDLDQEEVAKVFDRYSLVEVAVVDKWGRLKGRITADDVHEVLVEEADEDMLRVAGTAGEPELVYSNRILAIVGVRLPWLASTFVAGLIATWILQAQQDSVFGHVVILLSFVPVITGMSGNVGTQSAMIMIRGLAVGHIDSSMVARVVLKDVVVGAIMALICGLAVSGLITMWQGDGAVGLCVGISLFASMCTASLLGSLEPPLLQRFGIDPAIAAGPVITSMNDITGVLIYSTVARVFLEAMRHTG